MMNKEKFWELIDTARAAAGNIIRDSNCFVEGPQFCDYLKRELALLNLPDLIKWKQIYDTYHYTSYGDSLRLWAAAHFIDGYCSPDGFGYFRNWLIANGKAVYLKAIYNPDDLAELEINVYARLKGLSSVAEEAFAAKNGLCIHGDSFDFYKVMELCALMTEEEKKSIASEVIYAPSHKLCFDAIQGDYCEVKKWFPKLSKKYKRGWRTICAVNENAMCDSSILYIETLVDL